MDALKLKELAMTLHQSRQEGRELERLSLQGSISLGEAYLIQDEGISLRSARGEIPIGFKMGFTSEAKRKQMNLGAPIYGVLTNEMKLADGGTLSLKGSIHPKIEPEIAFLIGRELQGEISLETAFAACDGVAPALEILDSRYQGFKYFSLEDVVADNCSSSFFVVSKDWVPTREFRLEELAQLQIRMEANGKEEQSASSSAISGNPIQSVVQLCHLLNERGLALPAGSVVLAGAATAAIPLVEEMEVICRIERLGSVSVRT